MRETIGATFARAATSSEAWLMLFAQFGTLEWGSVVMVVVVVGGLLFAQLQKLKSVDDKTDSLLAAQKAETERRKEEEGKLWADIRQIRETAITLGKDSVGQAKDIEHLQRDVEKFHPGGGK